MKKLLTTMALALSITAFTIPVYAQDDSSMQMNNADHAQMMKNKTMMMNKMMDGGQGGMMGKQGMMNKQEGMGAVRQRSYAMGKQGMMGGKGMMGGGMMGPRNMMPMMMNGCRMNPTMMGKGGMMGGGMEPMMGYDPGRYTQNMQQYKDYQKFFAETRSQRKQLNDMEFEYREARWNPDTTLGELQKMREKMDGLRQEIYKKRPQK
jgi:hypothetical protein